MVTRQLESVLERHHCTEVQALGQPFDPHFHEAISQQPSDEHPANTVLHVAQTGFQLHDRVVRPSQVVVSVAPAKRDLDNTDKSDTQTTEPS
jgi:molecular chaperone GrpE